MCKPFYCNFTCLDTDYRVDYNRLSSESLAEIFSKWSFEGGTESIDINLILLNATLCI